MSLQLYIVKLFANALASRSFGAVVCPFVFDILLSDVQSSLEASATSSSVDDDGAVELPAHQSPPVGLFVQQELTPSFQAQFPHYVR